MPCRMHRYTSCLWTSLVYLKGHRRGGSIEGQRGGKRVVRRYLWTLPPPLIPKSHHLCKGIQPAGHLQHLAAPGRFAPSPPPPWQPAPQRPPAAGRRQTGAARRRPPLQRVRLLPPPGGGPPRPPAASPPPPRRGPRQRVPALRRRAGERLQPVNERVDMMGTSNGHGLTPVLGKRRDFSLSSLSVSRFCEHVCVCACACMSGPFPAVAFIRESPMCGLKYLHAL
jgi:hypothetical protein